jgi:protein-S-isoprenylcysteine O-methyltransferase
MIKKIWERGGDPLALVGVVSKGFYLVVPSVALSGFAFGLPLAITDNLSILLQHFAGVGFMLVFTAWLWVEAAFANHQSVATPRDRLWRLVFGVMIYGGVLITLLDFAQGPRQTHWLATSLGLFLASVGVALRYTSIRALGHFFTYELRIEPGHRLVQHGPYRFIRHPGYAGVLLLLAGLPLIFQNQNWYGFLWLGLVCGSFMIVRIPQEEAMLIEAFGDEYRAYIKCTKRLIPFVY